MSKANEQFQIKKIETFSDYLAVKNLSFIHIFF